MGCCHSPSWRISYNRHEEKQGGLNRPNTASWHRRPWLSLLPTSGCSSTPIVTIIMMSPMEIVATLTGRKRAMVDLAMSCRMPPPPLASAAAAAVHTAPVSDCMVGWAFDFSPCPSYRARDKSSRDIDAVVLFFFAILF